MKKTTYQLIAIVIFTSLFLLFIKHETQDENIETIESVIHHALSGPNDEFKEIISSEETSIDDLQEYNREQFEEYFADERAFGHFVMSSQSSRVLIEAVNKDFNIKVNNIDFDKTESEEIIYDFTVELEYQKEGSEKSKVEYVTGQANLNEEHKIEVILIRIDDLLNSLY